MKKEIVIVSDLWGQQKSEWLIHYERILSPKYNIKYYDACQLGEVNIEPYDQENLHRQFVDYGIKKAANQLVNLEKKSKIYIGCSVGGVIAYKAALLGLPIEKLITISSTRLRKETAPCVCPTQMYFGKEDLYKPDLGWYQIFNCKDYYLLEGGHDIYKKESSIEMILEDIITKGWI